MTTKQLGTLNPRNFKEKIELLKKKEAASTANFTAAIRDACEIRRIAVAYDLGRLKPHNTESAHAPLGKALSLPNMKSSSTTNLRLAPSAAELTTEKMEKVVGKIPSDAQNDLAPNVSCIVPHSLPPPSSALIPRLPTTTNERLSALLCTTSANFVSSDVQPHLNGLSDWSYKPPGSHSIGTNHHQLTYTGDCHPAGNIRRSQSMRHCSGPVSLSSDRAPAGYAEFKSDRHWLSTAPNSNVSSTPNMATGHRPLENSLHLLPPPNPCVDDNHIGNVVTTNPCNICDPRALPNYSPGSLVHSTPSPHGNSTNFVGSRHFFPQGYYKHPNNPALPSHVKSGGSNNTDMMLASQAAPHIIPRVTSTCIDWRRVSSDSSICNSLAACHPASRDIHSAYRFDTQLASPPRAAVTALPHAHSTAPFGCGFPAPGSKKPESLRRHFPTDSISGSAAYAAGCSDQPPDHFPLGCIEYHRPSEEQHLLPPKRPFTTAYRTSPLCLTGTAGHKYFGMHNLPLENSKRNVDPVTDASLSTNFGARQCLPTTCQTGVDSHPTFPHVDPVQQQQHLSCLSSVSAPNIVAAQHTAPWASREVANNPPPHPPPRTANSPLPDLSNCDPADLDRYLQIPGALLDSDDGSSKWTGRRDSCTMTAEVLSALSTVRNISPAFPPAKTPGVDTPLATVSRPTKASDLLAYNNPLPNLAESQDEYGSGEHVARSNPQPNLRRSGFQTVADQLGISITSKDYELLTDPQLVNYVTDETTEAQLLG